MSDQRSSLSGILWLFLLFIFGAIITYTFFSLFVPYDQRGITFYVVLSLVLGAEFVLFLHLTTPAIARSSGGIVTPPTRYMAQGAIFVWLITSIIVAIVALNPSRADQSGADKVILIDLVLMFFLCVFLYAIYSKGVSITQVTRELAAERAVFTFNVAEITQVMAFIRQIGQKYPEHAVLADRTHKKADTLRTAIEGILASERKLLSNEALKNWQGQVEAQLDTLFSMDDKLDLTSAQTLDKLNQISTQTDLILSTLKQRERALTF